MFLVYIQGSHDDMSYADNLRGMMALTQDQPIEMEHIIQTFRENIIFNELYNTGAFNFILENIAEYIENKRYHLIEYIMQTLYSIFTEFSPGVQEIILNKGRHWSQRGDNIYAPGHFYQTDFDLIMGGLYETFKHCPNHALEIITLTEQFLQNAPFSLIPHLMNILRIVHLDLPFDIQRLIIEKTKQWTQNRPQVIEEESDAQNDVLHADAAIVLDRLYKIYKNSPNQVSEIIHQTEEWMDNQDKLDVGIILECLHKIFEHFPYQAQSLILQINAFIQATASVEVNRIFHNIHFILQMNPADLTAIMDCTIRLSERLPHLPISNMIEILTFHQDDNDHMIWMTNHTKVMNRILPQIKDPQEFDEEDIAHMILAHQQI